MRYDRQGDQHYDVASALIKSIRGSDVDAALHYLARMVEAGEDPRFIARRLVISASEDIGMADPTALLTAVAAADAVALHRHARGPLPAGPRRRPPGHGAQVQRRHRGDRRVGRRRARRAGRAGAARAARRPLRRGEEAGPRQTYVYPHAHPDGVVPQQYPPDALVGKDYYRPTGPGVEARIGERLAKLRAIVRRGAEPPARSRRRPSGPATSVTTPDRPGAGQPRVRPDRRARVSAGEIAGLIAAGALVLLVVLLAVRCSSSGARWTRPR